MLTKEQEQDLVEKCVLGDKKAWDSFVSQYSKLIYNFIHKTLKRYGRHNNSDLVEEVFQEVFLCLLKDNCSKLNSFCWKNNCSITTWLGVVTTNLVLDTLRKDSRYKHRFESLDATDESEGGSKPALLEKISDQGSSALEGVYSQEQAQLLEAAINRLSASDQLLFKLIYKDDLTLEEVAQLMHKSMDALYMHKKRVLDKLRIEVEKYDVRY